MTATTVEVEGWQLRVSSLDRVLWPATGTTKAELLAYYLQVAPLLLPHLADRPVTLHRYPEGVGGPHFFQTRTPPHPPWVRTVTLSFPRTGKTFEAPVVDDLASLVWAVNLTTVELHPSSAEPATSRHRRQWCWTSIPARRPTSSRRAAWVCCCGPSSRRWVSRPTPRPPAARGCTSWSR